MITLMNKKKGDKKDTIYRQGDVLLRKIRNLPTGLKQKDKVLAYGEATNHSHQFKAPDDYVLVFHDGDGKQYVQVLKPTELQHEEHDWLDIEQGNYEVIQQREFDIVEGIRRVMD